MTFAELPPLYVTATADTTVRPVTLYVTTADLATTDLERIDLTADSTLQTADIGSVSLTADRSFVFRYELKL